MQVRAEHVQSVRQLKTIFARYEPVIFVHVLNTDDRQMLLSEKCYGSIDLLDGRLERLAS